MTIELQECAEDNYWHSSQNRSYTFSDSKKVKAQYVHGTEFQPHELRGVRVVIKSVLFGTPSNTKTFYIKNYDGYNKAFGQMYVNDSRGMIETFILDTIKNGMDKIDSMMQERIDARKRFVSLMGE